MNLVWEFAPVKADVLLVFLALADWSNDEGICWPSIDKLATKTRVHRRTVLRAISSLKALDMLEVESGIGRSKFNTFKIKVTNLHLFASRIGGNDSAKKVAAATRKGGSCDTKKVAMDTKTASVLSVDPSIDPSDDPKTDPSATQRKLIRGSRLSETFATTPEVRQWAATNAPLVNVDEALAEFRDYWMAIPGARGVKLDWNMTFRNRLRVLQSRAAKERRLPASPSVQSKRLRLAKNEQAA